MLFHMAECMSSCILAQVRAWLLARLDRICSQMWPKEQKRQPCRWFLTVGTTGSHLQPDVKPENRKDSRWPVILDFWRDWIASAARCETREQKRQPLAGDSWLLARLDRICSQMWNQRTEKTAVGNEISSTSSNTSLLRVQYPVYNSNTRVLQSTFQKANQRQRSWSESIKWMSLGNSFLANRGMLANNMKG